MATQVSLKRSSGLPSVGTHVFKILRYSEEMGPKGPYWRFAIRVEDGPDQGKEMLLQISLSETARFKMDEFLDAVKAPLNGMTTGDRYVGKYFRGTVSHDTDGNGKVRPGISDMLPYDGQLVFAAPDRPSVEEDEEAARMAASDIEEEEVGDDPF